MANGTTADDLSEQKFGSPLTETDVEADDFADTGGTGSESPEFGSDETAEDGDTDDGAVDSGTTDEPDPSAVAGDVEAVIALLAIEAGVEETGTGLTTDVTSDEEAPASTAGVPIGQQPSATPTNEPDELTGTSAPDTIDGLAGDDTILGLEGNDILIGSADADRLFGGLGADSLNGGDGTDFLEGGAQADTFFGGSDIARDIVSYARSDSAVSVNLLNGTASGGHAQGDNLTNINDLRGSNFDDTLVGDNSDNLIEGGRGADELVGQQGDLDLLSYVGSSASVQVDLDSGEASGGDADGDVIVGFEGVIGSRFDDELRTGDTARWAVGGAGEDDLTGGAGADFLVGGADDDRIAGGANFNTLYGGDGDDELVGGADYDQLFGGAGTDTLTANGADDDFIFDPAEFAATLADADHITDYDAEANQWVRIVGGTWDVTDITQANSTGYSFDPATKTIVAPGGDDIVAILDNWDGGAVLLGTWT